MQVLVSSKNFSVTKALRAYTKEQAEKVLRMSEHVIKIRVFLESIEKLNNDPKANRAKVVVEIPGNDILVEKRAIDMYEAVLKAFEVAQRHVRKHHEKLQTKRRKGKKEIESMEF